MQGFALNEAYCMLYVTRLFKILLELIIIESECEDNVILNDKLDNS